MDQLEIIRRMVLVDGLSQREVARRLGHSRKTIRKAINSADEPIYQLGKPRPRPKLDPFVSIVGAWLRDDLSAPKKQRHTATRIFQRLCEEYQYDGSRRAVSDLVRKLRAQQAGNEVFVPIEHPAGQEVQIDWGQATVTIGGEQTTVHLFCARLAHSKASFVRAYLREDLPSFLDAHVHLIEYLQGVPAVFAYDNLKSAVAKIVGRSRQLNAKFQQLRSHYLFKTRFCNVARGNEKGHAENLVKHAQRSYLTPVPAVINLEQLNEELLANCRADLGRTDKQTGKTYGELLADEQAKFQPCPQVPFAAVVVKASRADKASTVVWAGARYSVPAKHAGNNVVIRAGVDTIEVVAEQETIARHARVPGGQTSLLLEHYVSLLETKPGLLESGIPFKNGRWSDSERRLRRELEQRDPEHGTRRFIDTILLAKEFSYSKVQQAIASCVKQRVFHEEAVRMELRKLEAVTSQDAPAALHLDDQRLVDVPSGIADLAQYDSLVANEAESVSPPEDHTDSNVAIRAMQRSACSDSQTEESPSTSPEESNSADTGDTTANARIQPAFTPTANLLGGVCVTLTGMF